MVIAPLTCPWHSLFLCMPSLRLFLATGHHSAHAQDRWKYCGVSAPWEHSSTNKWWDLVDKYPSSLTLACSHSEVFALHCLPEVPRGIEPQLLKWKLIWFDNIPFISCHPCLISALPFQCFLRSPALESLSQCLFLREPNQSQRERKEQRQPLP